MGEEKCCKDTCEAMRCVEVEAVALFSSHNKDEDKEDEEEQREEIEEEPTEPQEGWCSGSVTLQLLVIVKLIKLYKIYIETYRLVYNYKVQIVVITP